MAGGSGTVAAMRAIGAPLLGLFLALGCGSGEPTAPPPEITPVVDPVAPEPTPAPSPPVELEPAAPAVPTPTEGLAPGDVLALTRGTIEIFHSEVQLDVVAYAPEAQEAIVTHLRTMIREALEAIDWTPRSDDPEFPNELSGACSATLALADLVSYGCSLYVTTGRGSAEYVTGTRTWEITNGTTLREVELYDVLLPGVDEQAIAEEYAFESGDPFSLGATGLVFVDLEGESHVAPYDALGTLMSPSSILARVPAAVAAFAATSELTVRAAPPTELVVLQPAMPLARVALLAWSLGSSWVFADGGAGIDLGSSVFAEAPPSPGARATATVPWSAPGVLSAGRLRRATALRPRPRGHVEGPALPAGTAVIGVLGDLAAGPSRTSAGQWVLVVASESRAGWIPAGLFGDGIFDTSAARSAFVHALPEAQRAEAEANAILVASDQAVFATAEPTPGTSTAAFLSLHDGTRYGVRLVVSHVGTLADARSVRTSASDPAATHVLLGWLVPGDESRLSWELYRIPTAGGPDPGAPLLTLPLALPTAPERERVTINTALTRRGTYYPFVVRGPGRAETLYTWDGTSFVAPPAE